ncbi:MAG: ACT domain-containing protein [Coriobacteriia bacterium]|nr:ACT domain-containing protein [Coriobacteriia bacterium]MCL2746401.1 ACT domain-containing protein [Coriobacteriia bacterium]MCL2871004.1 ACT domain-containing protein [Coriobacteriia bacterium]
MQKTNAVITVNGQDKVGIISTVSGILSKNNVNIANITQTIMQSFFTMVMMVDISEMSTDFEALTKELEIAGEDLGVQIRIQHEAIFNSMHRL